MHRPSRSFTKIKVNNNELEVEDFPITGHKEVRYSEEKKKVIYEPVKLEQDYRNFDYNSPWQGTEYIKEIKKNNE